MKKYTSRSEKDTKQIAQNIACEFKDGVVALIGELGAGKTIFVKGFAKGLGITDKITSPTFVLIRQHKIPKTKKTLFHIDLYRIENIENLNQLGLKELWLDKKNIILIEWPEKLENLLPTNTTLIKIEKRRNNTRLITTDRYPLNYDKIL